MVTFMIFGLLVGALVATACALLESVFLRAKYSVRWVWFAGMVGTVVLIALAATRTASRAPLPVADNQTATILAARSVQRDPAVQTRPTARAVDIAQQRVSRATRDSTLEITPTRFAQRVLPSLSAWIDTRSAQLRASTEAADRPLMAMWAISSAVLAIWLLTNVLRSPTSATATQGHRLRSHNAQQMRHDANNVIVTDHIGPAAVGLWRGHILMPRWVLDLEPQLYTLILQHEREHLRARDPLVRVLALLMIVLVPWQIPLWFMARRLRLAMEFDCDARVLRNAPDVRRYASLLMLVSANGTLTRSNTRLLTPLVYMTTAAARSALQRRILVMTQPLMPARGVLSLATGVLAVLLTGAAILLPIPSHSLFAQKASGPTRGMPTQTRTDSDSVVNVRFVLGSMTFIGKRGEKFSAYALQPATPFDDPNAGFTTINVTSVSGKPTDVVMFVERRDGERALKSDTSRTRTPFSLVRRSDLPTFHLRSVNGDSLLVTSPAAVSPVWATKIRGTHFLLMGVNQLGIVQP